MKYRFKKKYIAQTLWYIARGIIILGLCYLILYPFFMKFANAFKSYSDFVDPTVRFIPKAATLTNISSVIEKIDYWQTLLNTGLVALAVALITTFISSSVGYGLARFKFRGSTFLFVSVILTLVVPPQTVIIPLFLQFKDFLGVFKLLGTAYPVIILALTGLSLKNGLYIFLMRQYYKNMPKELEEAAYLDGCGAIRTYFYIMFPSGVSLMATVFLLSLAWTWTDTVYNPLFFQDFRLFANVISLAATGETNIMGANMTSIAALLAVIPLAIIYVFAQRLFVQSVERAGIVG